MPNTGKPSGGCHACRRMKVRCDEARPGCKRCARGKRECPGYRDATQFRSMNERLESRDPSRGRCLTRREPRDESEPEPRPTSLVSAGGGPLVSRPLSADWEQAAVACFFEDFCLPENAVGPCTGYYDFLEDMCTEEMTRSTDSYVLEATKAAACAAFANRHSAETLVVRARRHYGKALTAVNAALNDPVEVVRDEALTAITLLGLYEVRPRPLSSRLPSP